MKERILLVIILILSSANTFAQRFDDDIYEVVPSVFQQNKIVEIEKMAIDSESLARNSDTKEYILWCIKESHKELLKPEVDTAFIEHQLKAFKKFKWSKNKIPSGIELKKDSYDSFSVPVFLTTKKDSFLIFHDECCNIESGSGTCQFYRKENGKWVLISQILTWIS